MAAFRLTDSQKVTGTVVDGLDKKGNPASLPGKPVWTTSSPDVLSVTPADDGMSAVIAATGKMSTSGPTTAQVTVTAGDAPNSIQGVQDFEIVAGPATTIGISLGTPAEQ